MEKKKLKGGCYILPVVSGGGNTKKGGGPLSHTIGSKTGALHLSQFRLDVKEGQSLIYSFGSSDVLLFVIDGHPTVTISGRNFKASPEAGLYVRPHEAFRVDGDAALLVTVCPEVAPEQLTEMPNNFDEAYPERLVAPDASLREEMGDRYYQVLASTGQVTQFIGEVPKSKAPSHHHLYEEALYVLEGSGFMWTGDVKAHVGPGSIIFLPKKQEHALECTSDGGLRVAGHFFPAGSPAENY